MVFLDSSVDDENKDFIENDNGFAVITSDIWHLTPETANSVYFLRNRPLAINRSEMERDGKSKRIPIETADFSDLLYF